MKPISPFRPSSLSVLALACVVLAGCAAGDPRFSAEAPAGFWQGVWHGLIAFFTFVIGLFSDNVEMYERANNGSWYDAGFLLGIGMIVGSSNMSKRAREFNKSIEEANARRAGK